MLRSLRALVRIAAVICSCHRWRQPPRPGITELRCGERAQLAEAAVREDVHDTGGMVGEMSIKETIPFTWTLDNAIAEIGLMSADL